MIGTPSSTIFRPNADQYLPIDLGRLYRYYNEYNYLRFRFVYNSHRYNIWTVETFEIPISISGIHTTVRINYFALDFAGQQI